MSTKPFRTLIPAGMALAFLGAIIASLVVPSAVEAQSASNPVQNLSATQVSTTSIQVKWDAPASGTVYGYQVSWTGPESGRSRLAAQTRTYEIKDLDAGTYTVTVEVLLAGYSGYSNAATATITLSASFSTPTPTPTPAPAPAPKPDVQASGGLQLTQDTINSIKVTWGAPASGNVWIYRVSWKGPQTGQSEESYATHTRRIQNLNTAGTYTVTVEAWISGASGYSPHLKGTIELSDGSPRNLSATAVTDDTIFVSWDPPAFPTSIHKYSVRAFIENDLSSAKYVEVTGDKENATISNLIAGKKYIVQAISLSGDREPINFDPSETEVTTLATPGTVTNLSAEAIVNGLSMSWTALPESEDISSYHIDYTANGSNYGGRIYTIYPVDGVFPTSYTIENLTTGEEQKVRVRACAATILLPHGVWQYCGAWAETTGTPAATPTGLLDVPSAPQNLRLTITNKIG